MITQWYLDTDSITIFQGDCYLAEICLCPSVHIADDRLRALGFRRREKWQKTDWGFEAKLRRLERR